MRVLVIGDPESFNECQDRLKSAHECHHMGYDDAREKLMSFDVVIDFMADPSSCRSLYTGFARPVFLNSIFTTLLQLVDRRDRELPRFGFNGLHGFILMPLLEVTLLEGGDVGKLDAVMRELRLDYRLVQDRVGMVTARILCMIINEAFFTVQEGTATRDDIEIAMKLGTNYPYGPFEWCQRIGVNVVYRLLESVYQDTHDMRYKISPLLKKEYLRSL